MTGRFPTKKLTLSALSVALACMATTSTHTPTPGTGGYIHLDNAIMVLYGVFLDPIFAFLTAGIGSCTADLLGSYFIYVPITFTIKDSVIFSTSHVCRSLRVREINPYVAVVNCGVTDIVLAAGGYCMCGVSLHGLGTVLASVPSNIIQGISGLIISSALYPVLQKPFSMALKV